MPRVNRYVVVCVSPYCPGKGFMCPDNLTKESVRNFDPKDLRSGFSLGLVVDTPTRRRR